MQAPGLQPRWLSWCAAALGAVFAVWAYLAWRAQPAAFDDAFISFRYAQNLLGGQGLVYNPGERVEGYTNFAWTLLAAGGMALGQDPLATTRVIGVSAYMGCAVLTSLVLYRGLAGRIVALSGFLALFLLVRTRDYPVFAGTGLETPFVSFLVLALGVLYHVHPARSLRGWALRGCVPALLLMTRLDAAPFVLASVVATTLELGPSGGRAVGRALFQRYAVAAVLVALWLGWKLAYYGDLLPNTFYAKGAQAAEMEAGVAYLRTFIESYPALLVALPLMLVATFRPPERLVAFCRFAALGLTLYLVYLVRVGGDFMHYRFAFQVLPVAVVLSGVGLIVVSRLSGLAALSIGGVLAVLSPGSPKLETKFYMQSIAEMNEYYELGLRVGGELGAALPSSAVLSTGMAGGIAYASQLVNVDELGLCDEYIARLPAQPGPRGHIKHAPREYMLARGVNLVLMHPTLCSCSRPCPGRGPHVFVRIQDDQCLKAEYLVRTPELTQHFCAHPERFVLTGLGCGGR